MKKYFLAIVLIIYGWNSFAQKDRVKYITTFDDKRLHFGFTLGTNTLDLGVENYSSDTIRCDVASLSPGFTVGIVASLRLSESFNLRVLPGLSFGERTLTYNIPVVDIYNNSSVVPNTYTIRSTYLDLPILLKYKARRINNDRPYIIFGGAIRQDISRTAQEDLVQLTKTGLYAEVGGGWDHYFPFFRFSVEAKFSFGLNNQIGDIPDTSSSQSPIYSQSINKLNSKIFTLSFHFE